MDFTDLNKACPKDCFSLPQIDQLVDSMVGNELDSLCVAFSRYNQIKIHMGNHEKTTFITSWGYIAIGDALRPQERRSYL